MWVRMSGAGRVGAVLVAAVLVLTGGASAVAGERDPEGPPVAASAAPVGLSPAPAADGVPRPGGGDPSGAPSAEAGVGTLAAGATTLTFDEDARQARLRVDDGGTLDQYLYGPGPITFDIDLNGLDPTPAGGQPVELRLFTYDVDQAGSEECGPEVDRVLANGRPIGTLTGANEQWIVNTFSIPPGTLQRDVNSFRIDIDTAGTGCWGVRVDWAEITLPFNIAQLSADATDDVTARRGTSDDVIPDRIFERAFDSAGALTAPTSDDPIVDAMNDSHWFSGPTAGTFTYAYALDAWPAKPDWAPTVKARWQFSDGSAGSAPAGVTGWEGDVTIDVPTRTGKYELTVWFEISKDGTVLVEQQRKTTVYVLLGQPLRAGLFGPQGGADTSTPKTQWLDRAFELGAGGWAAPKIILQTLMIRIYGNPLGWSYVGADPYSTPVELIEGTGTRGECFTFRDVWWILALSLGINASDGGYAGTTFLTTQRPALDGNASANAIPAGGAAADRWVFGSHGWGTWGGERFDPTFGFNGAGTSDAAFKADSVQCEVVRVDAGNLICAPIVGTEGHVITPTGSQNATGWPMNTYAPLSPQQRQQSPPAVPRAAAVVPASDSGEDTDGNGLFDRLRVDVPVTAATAGEHMVFLHLQAPDGTYLGTGTVDPGSRANVALQVALPAGDSTVAVRFAARPIRAGGSDGPYTVTGDVRAPGGAVIAEVEHATQPYRAAQFQGPLADVGTPTDELVGDQLRVHVPVVPTGSGPISVTAQLFAGDRQVGAAARDATLAAGAGQDVAIDFPTGPTWANGADGPYTVHLSVRDASSTSSFIHTTAAYDADDLAPPAVRIGPDVTDEGRDTDGDAAFDALAVSFDLAATVPGTVTVRGTLATADGKLLTSRSVTVDAGTDPSDVTVEFDGGSIAQSRADGPYEVALAVTDASGIPQMTRVHRTDAYSADRFDAPVAVLTGAYADSEIDTNGDSIPDVLRIEAGVALAADADVTLSGTLVDAAGSRVAEAVTGASLRAGTRTIRLDFDGADLAGVAGPFVLTGVELGRTGEAPEVTALDVHTTPSYASDRFLPGGTFSIGSVADRGVDDDGNGLFDSLAVDIGVRVLEAGYFSANARLTTATGREIQWSGTQQPLEPGEHMLTLLFDGRLIAAAAADGPYFIESVSVYDVPIRTQTQREPHPTAAYRSQDFEPGAAFAGQVISDGMPVPAVAVAVPGVAYAVTDAAGAYRLALPEGGTYELVLTADPVLAPWRILVDGTERATGTGVTAAVVDGGATTVDFVRGEAPDRPPEAAFVATPTSGAAPLAVVFDGSGSTDPDGAIEQYAWDFGDGAAGSGAVADHTYTSPGSYTVTLTVTDDSGATDTETATITVTATTTGDHVSLTYAGGVRYANAAELTDGDLVVTRAGSRVVSVTGSGSIPGAHGGIATVSFSVHRIGKSPLYVGTIRVADPGSSFRETTRVFSTQVRGVGTTGAAGSATWVDRSGGAYRLSWTVDDPPAASAAGLTPPW